MANPTYDQVNGDYQKYLGRNASQDEFNNYWVNVPDYNSSYIANSPEGLAWTNKQVPGTPGYDPGAGVFTGNDTGQPGGAIATAATPAPNTGSPDYIIDQLYKQYGISDGGNGSGFADRAYWLAHPSEILNGRLAADLAGTGSDQPTGTPGSGPWQNSGSAARNASGTAAPPAAAGAPPPTAGAPATTTAAPTSAAPASTAAPISTESPALKALYDQLLARSQQSLTVDANDPAIKAQVDAARLTGERSLLTSREALAERAGPYATGVLSNNARTGAESLANNLSTLTGNLINNEVTARRTEIAQALSGMYGVLSLEEQSRLREEDQKLQARQLDQTQQQNEWMRTFQEQGFTADQAYRLWQEAFQQKGQDETQANTAWDQAWKTSGGA